MPDRDSQLLFQRDSKGVCCLVYSEDTCTKSNDGGLAQMRNNRKIVWVYPSDNVERCSVCLVDKYISLCPCYFKKSNFYLQSKQRLNLAQWYSEQVVGSNSLGKVVKQLLSDAKIDGYFTNLSLKRSAPTRLFQAGVKCKLVKEVTEYRSDAVDSYQITSEDQHCNLSEIIAKKPNVTLESGNLHSNVKENVTEESEKETLILITKCNCRDGMNSVNIGQIIDH